MVWFLRQLLYFRRAVTAQDTPGQIAAGFAMGMLLGLVPKGNLLAISISLIIFASRANLGVAMVSALAFSILGPFCDPVTHRVGLALLTWNALEPTWVNLYNLPLVPWTAFNNTVVLGSLALGLGLVYPAFYCVQRYCERRRARQAPAVPSPPPESVAPDGAVAATPAPA
jgi:uncharacterized protein (TIGR03546 family)